MKNKNIRKYLFSFLLLCPFAVHAQLPEKGYVLTSQVWNQKDIPVCWVNPSPSNEKERLWVKNAVSNTWEAASNVKFTGWEKCPATNRNDSIRILINDSGPHVKVLGAGIRYYNDGMVLNFTFNNWASTCANSTSYRKYCIEAISVHEFGHALSFAHEQNRPDTPSWCDQEQGTNGNIVIGDWDLNSVMNYCNPNWNGNGLLSDTDILTVQTFYGKPDTNPFAKIKNDRYSTRVSGSLTFDGTQSYDPEGSALTYSWRFGDTSETVASTSPYIDHTFNIPGNYAIFLTVDDGINSSQPDVASVTVYDPVKVMVPILGLLLN